MITKVIDKSIYPELLEVWESAVKATHDFLIEEDFNFFKSQIPLVYLPQLSIFSYTLNNEIVGFMGIDGNKLEMLFIHNSYRGKGIGKSLLKYAIDILKIEKVDVNEQNIRAIGFYNKFGFKKIGLSKFDTTGKSYPINHMSL